MFLNTLIALLAEVTQEVQTNMNPNAPVTVQSVVLIIGALGGIMTIFGTFVTTLVTAFLTLRNGMKSDLNAAKADANAVKQDVTHAKLEEVSKRLNGELDTKLQTLAEKTYTAGANSVAAPMIEAAAEKAKEVLAAAVPIAAAEIVKHAADKAAADAATPKLIP